MYLIIMKLKYFTTRIFELDNFDSCTKFLIQILATQPASCCTVWLHNVTYIIVDVWGNYSECSVTCGNGTQYRTRECAGDCKNENSAIQYKDCDMGCCPGKIST